MLDKIRIKSSLWHVKKCNFHTLKLLNFPKMNAKGVQCKKMQFSQLHDVTFVIPMLRLCCCWSSDQARGATQARRSSSLFPPWETQTTQFVFMSSFFRALLPVDGLVAAIRRCASPVSLSRDAGRLTALMAVKISGKNVDSWESHRQCKGGWKREFTT